LIKADIRVFSVESLAVRVERGVWRGRCRIFGRDRYKRAQIVTWLTKRPRITG